MLKSANFAAGAALAGLLALAAAGCGGPDTPSRQDTTAPASPPPAGEAAVRVTIDQFAYSPPELTVTAGTRVTWVNRDDVPHTVTSVEKPRRFGSGTLDTDDQFTHRFTTPGTYEYFCAVHPKMTARVIVK
ncbi:MAG TPA: cupredoxin family copper-binding protein [Gemmataceae bacterium]|jgi:plastocyanin|nr:cupredoxin family copper-binding protein [Gemmataceae bacterium]